MIHWEGKMVKANLIDFIMTNVDHPGFQFWAQLLRTCRLEWITMVNQENTVRGETFCLLFSAFQSFSVKEKTDLRFP